MEGYKNLSTYILATVICDLNVEFISRNINFRSRTKDQMETYLLTKQIAALKEKFVAEGGFRENLFRARMERKKLS